MIAFQLGDMVLAALDLFNDEAADDGGSLLPGVAVGALLAPAGCRGVVVNIGHVAAAPQQVIYLVRFETGPDRTLGPPFGCLPEDLCEPPRT